MDASRRSRPAPKQDLSLQVVPLIDIMFLLLLFFMLGADMSRREAPELELPAARALRPDPEAPLERTLVANVHHVSPSECAVHAQGGECRLREHWRSSILGVDLSRAELARELVLAAAENPEPREGAPGSAALAAPGSAALATPGSRAASALHLLVRADARAPYDAVQSLIQSAAPAGLYRLELAAARPADAARR